MVAKKENPVKTLTGRFVTLRDVDVSDARFILDLRCSEKKSKYLHSTDNDVTKQENYIRRYKTLDNEWYFIIENSAGFRIGTYRIYDLKDDSFSIGSWLMVDGTSPQEAMEADFLIRSFGFNELGFTKTHFEVSKGNNKVFRFHKQLGGVVVAENDIEYYFECTKEAYFKAATTLMEAML